MIVCTVIFCCTSILYTRHLLHVSILGEGGISFIFSPVIEDCKAPWCKLSFVILDYINTLDGKRCSQMLFLLYSLDLLCLNEHWTTVLYNFHLQKTAYRLFLCVCVCFRHCRECGARRPISAEVGLWTQSAENSLQHDLWHLWRGHRYDRHLKCFAWWKFFIYFLVRLNMLIYIHLLAHWSLQPGSSTCSDD